MTKIKETSELCLIRNDFSLEVFVHSNNVANIVMRIADEMKLSHQEKIQLYEVALYHDIGKSKIPEEILYKEGKLSSEEWEIMKKHTIYSETLYLCIANNNNASREKAKIIRSHHENWDGTGYPDGIKGEDIPLYSRMIRIADIFDAITQPRVYRPYSVEKPMEVMEKMQGKEIDPVIFEKSYSTLEKILLDHKEANVKKWRMKSILNI